MWLAFKFPGILLSFVILGISSCSVAAASPPRSAPPPISLSNLEAFVDGIAADRMDDLDPTAMMVAVVRGDEGFAKAYGIADLEKRRGADESTLFRVGSISKTFTWLSVMMLVEEGKIDLSADVNKYLTQLKIPEKFGKPVTMKDIMAHRAGFEDTLQIFWDPRQDAALADALINTMPTRVAPPGERISYSNWASTLAALIVQNRSGLRYDKFVEQRILRPLGMTSTTLHDPEVGKLGQRNPAMLDARMARPMRMKNGRPEQTDYALIEAFHPAGAVAMDARDAATYMRMLLCGTCYEGGQLLSDETWSQMQAMAFSDSEGADDMSYGFQKMVVAGFPAFGHAGATAFRANMVLIPELDMGVFVAENSTQNYAEVRELVELVVRRVAGSAREPVIPVTSRSLKDAKELAGTYIANRRSFTRAEKFTSLGMDRTFTAGVDGSVTTNYGGNIVRFVQVGNDVWVSNSGQRIKALRDKGDRIFRLSTGSDTMDRAGFLEKSATFNIFLGLVLALSVTSLLGAWWRFRREVPATAAGQRLRFVPLVAAFVWLSFAGTVAWVTVTLAAIEPGAFASGNIEYPPISAKAALVMAMVAAVVTAVSLIAIIPVWLKSGWSIWRRIHFTIYATAMAAAVAVMWNWNMIGKPLYDVS